MIVISPYSRLLKNGAQNPKNYPHWEELLAMIKESHPDLIISQAIDKDEPKLQGARVFVKTNLKTLPRYLASPKLKLVLSVDNFMPHLCHSFGINNCVVIFGQSDPRIYGYREYLNIIGDEKYFMPNQFCSWEEAKYIPEAFPPASYIYNAIKQFL